MPGQKLPLGSKVGQSALNCGGVDNKQNAGDISFSSIFNWNSFNQIKLHYKIKLFADSRFGGDTLIGQNAENSGADANNQTSHRGKGNPFNPRPMAFGLYIHFLFCIYRRRRYRWRRWQTWRCEYGISTLRRWRRRWFCTMWSVFCCIFKNRDNLQTIETPIKNGVK